MSCGCNVFTFCEMAGSSRGLQARIVLADDSAALRDDITAIGYAVYNVTDETGPVTGVLDPVDVMLTALAEWDVDDVGYSFIWQAPGTLWPDADKQYRIAVTFLTSAEHGAVDIIQVWEVEAGSLSGF